MRLFSFILLSLFFVPTSFGQVTCTDLPLITVQATARVESLPDVAIVVVKVEKQVLLSGMNSSSDTFFFMKEDMDIKYVDDKNITQTFIESKMGAETSLFVKYFIITVNNLSNLQKLYTDLAQRNFTQIESVRFRISNLDAIKDSATKEALNRAKEKAQLLATEIGQPLGTVHKIVEQKSEPVNWYEERGKTDAATLLGDNYLLNPAYITVVSNLEVSYNLLNQ